MPEHPGVDDRSVPTTYRIHVGVVPSGRWAGWFSDAEVTGRDDGASLITAAVRDQAMLFGLLLRVRDLGIPLLGVYPARQGHDEP
jgi:hypothetical protein